MKAEIVICVYHPKPGKEKTLDDLIAKHVPTLRRLELATERPAIVARSKSGARIEIFEWRSREASEKAHDVPEVIQLWEALGACAEFGSLKSLPESEHAFSHFAAVS